jgi:DNA-binding LacI/PurR family transcriptional regulator
MSLIGFKKSLTMKDIADFVGVSVATVSLAIKNDPRIKEKTRRRVLASVKDLDYRVNENARRLSQKKTEKRNAFAVPPTTATEMTIPAPSL